MNIGMIGLGKLGLPVAVALGQHHRVIGYDVNDKLLSKRQYEHKEEGFGQKTFQEMFDKADISFTSLNAVAAQCDLIFVAVQTPHLPKFEGVTRLDDERADFDYKHLINAATDLAASPNLRPGTTVVIISTCLPGTIRKHVIPVFDGKASVVYNPFFIAMGTVVQDFYNPEFVLVGGDNQEAIDELVGLYVHLRRDVYGENMLPLHVERMSIESAELTKVAYNTYIGMKIAYANTIMEISAKIPRCNVDDVMGAIKAAGKRLISPAYLSPGMGDGGGCHPRDNIAMSWLARKLNLSHDLFYDIMKTREDQAAWLVDLVLHQQRLLRIAGENPGIVILGKAFKPETNIVTGSSSILCSNILKDLGVEHEVFDPFIDGSTVGIWKPSIFLVGTKHAEFAKYKFPQGSIVLDPHRYIPDQEGAIVLRIGEHK